MKTERKRQLKGSVLFTVVSVMSLLIIFLMATLVLATSAGKRAHKSYSTSQTQYTARTAVDSVFQAIGASQDFADAIDALSASNKGPLNVDVQIDDASSMGRIESCTVTWEGSQSFYNETKKEWEIKDLLKITANVTLGGQTTTGSSYILKDPPQTTTQNGGGAGFVTAGGAQTENHTSAFGGTYFNIREYVNPSDITTAYATLPYDFTTKNYLTNELFSLANGQVIEANLVVNGDLHTVQSAILAYPAAGTGIAVWGDFIMGSSGSGLEFTAYNITNDMDIEYTEIPYLYVDECLSAERDIDIGNGTFPMNVFCGWFDFKGGSADIYADIYCMDENKTSTLSGTTETGLYAWTSSVINKTVSENSASHTYGNIYSKGNVEITAQNATVINGDIRVKGNLTINSLDGVEVKGDVVVGGTLTVNNSNNGVKLCTDNGSALYCDNIVNNAGTGKFKVNGTSFGISELKPGFVQIDNIYHEPSYTVNTGYKETKHIPNFYTYEVPDTRTGLIGENIDWFNNGVVYYKYSAYDPAAPDDINTIDTSRYYHSIGQYQEGGFMYTEVDANYIPVVPQTFTDVPAYYYEMATGDKVDASVATTVIPEYYTMANYDGTNITDSGVPTTELLSYFDCTAMPATPPTRVSEAAAKQISSNESVANYKDPERSTPTKPVTNIYPVEMEKKVILGMNNAPGDPVIYGYKNGNYQALTKDDTQIIQTVKDIVNNNSINPYNNALYTIPSGFMNEVNNNVYNDASVLGTADTVTGKDSLNADTTLQGGTAANPITKSCTIKGGTIGSDVYFEPADGKQIWVKIDGNVSMNNIHSFIFKDEGKLPTTKLNIILTSGSSLSLVQSNIVSEKMWNLINNPSSVLTITNFSGITNPAGSTELDPAQIYIYTEKNTTNTDTIATLSLSDGQCLVTANVKAPYLDFKCLTGYEFQVPIYYNGAMVNGYNLNTATDVQTPPLGNYDIINNPNKTINSKFIVDGSNAPTNRIPVIGCLNVGEASELQNEWVVLYIDPNKNAQQPIQTPNNSHWYQTIYYDEY